jgi:predicted DCC family thiol-disulfide oxidoreductase YuxK
MAFERVNGEHENGWTGGQYSVFRFLLGTYLAFHFLHLLPWVGEVFSSAGMLPSASLSPLTRVFPNILAITDTPAAAMLLCCCAVMASLALAAGWHDRLAALLAWYVLACFFGRNPLIQNPSLPYLGWMLLLHAALPSGPPSGPYGSWAARGRNDPGGAWALPASLFAAAWIVMAVSYSYSGYTKLFSPSWVSGDTVSAVLRNPLARDWFLRDAFLALPPIALKLITWGILVVELLFAPICLWRRARPWAWLAMLVVQFGFLALLSFPDLTIAMLLFHLLTFDPAWLKPRNLEGTVVYFDGDCALCHGVVRFLVAEDQSSGLRFAPLGSTFTARTIAPKIRAALPLSMLVRKPDGQLLIEDDGLLHLLAEMGGLWRLIAGVARAVPKPLRGHTYHAIGRRRIAVFGAAKQACPVLAEGLRQRVVTSELPSAIAKFLPVTDR